MHTDDTIVAIATPAGRGGIGVVRLSGSEAVHIAQQVLRAKQKEVAEVGEVEEAKEAKVAKRATESSASSASCASCTSSASLLNLSPGRIIYAELPDEQGATLDHVLVSYFKKPRSYTAEDVIEISSHGAPVILQFLISRCMQAGARLAEPGEFSMRAFLNGRLDLTQAEAVRDLIEAQTLYQAKVAAGQMEGAVSHRLRPIKKQLVDVIALLEAGIDFAEDDVSVLSNPEIAARLEPVERALEAMAQSFLTGQMIHRGLTLAIVGRPNVGKSSLFNCLLQQDRAIVTATPGTTRDLVAETVELQGVPLRFVDTAGIRQAFEEAEAIGVRKSYQAAADSDLALLVLNGAEDLAPEDHDLLRRLTPLGRFLIVVNKCDLPPRLSIDVLGEALRQASAAFAGHAAAAPPIVRVSALRRQGMEELRQAIVETALPALCGQRETHFLTSARHQSLIQEALRALGGARQALQEGIPHEMLLLDLYNALRPLDTITGETTVEDILSRIFSTFCVGK